MVKAFNIRTGLMFAVKKLKIINPISGIDNETISRLKVRLVIK